MKTKATEVISFVCIQVDKQKFCAYLNKSYDVNYEIIQCWNDENHWFLSLPKGRLKEQKNGFIACSLGILQKPCTFFLWEQINTITFFLSQDMDVARTALSLICLVSHICNDIHKTSTPARYSFWKYNTSLSSWQHRSHFCTTSCT